MTDHQIETYEEQYARISQLPIEDIREEYSDLGIYWDFDMSRKDLLGQYPIYVAYTKSPSNSIRLIHG